MPEEMPWLVITKAREDVLGGEQVWEASWGKMNMETWGLGEARTPWMVSCIPNRSGWMKKRKGD